MTAYRTSSGPTCPRCELLLARVRDDEFACSDGCGSWLGNDRLPLDPAALASLSTATPPTPQSALPFTRCLVCRRSLTDFYKGVRAHVMALGQCLEHGVWLERHDRATFETMYLREIRDHAGVLARREAERAHNQAESESKQAAEAYLASLPPDVADLVKRVTILERTVMELARELAALRARPNTA